MKNFKEFKPALGFDWLTGYYDLAIKLTMPEQKFRSRLVDFVDPQDKDLILEFGFGTGKNLILINERNSKAKLYGIDIDPKVKMIAERNLSKYFVSSSLALYDGNNLPFEDNTFDTLVSSLVFHHLGKPGKISVLKEMYRVLKPDGKLVIGDWGKPKNKLRRLNFYLVQLIDGFATTEDNVRGLLPSLIEQSNFNDVHEVDYINTSIGTYCYYLASKR